MIVESVRIARNRAVVFITSQQQPVKFSLEIDDWSIEISTADADLDPVLIDSLVRQLYSISDSGRYPKWYLN